MIWHQIVPSYTARWWPKIFKREFLLHFSAVEAAIARELWPLTGQEAVPSASSLRLEASKKQRAERAHFLAGGPAYRHWRSPMLAGMRGRARLRYPSGGPEVTAAGRASAWFSCVLAWKAGC